MVFSLTGIAYLFLFLSMGVLTYRFFQYWQEKKDIISKFFIYFGICFTLLGLFKAISCLFFINNVQVLIASVIFACFIEGLAAAFVAYLIIYMRFPKFSPMIGFWIIFFLGLIATVLTIILKPANPFIESSGAINWGFSSESTTLIHYYIFRAGILLITFIPLIINLIPQIKAPEDIYIRNRALGLILLFSVGIVIGLLDFIFIEIFDLNAISRDVSMIFLSILIFLVIFLIRKPTPLETK